MDRDSSTEYSQADRRKIEELKDELKNHVSDVKFNFGPELEKLTEVGSTIFDIQEVTGKIKSTIEKLNLPEKEKYEAINKQQIEIIEEMEKHIKRLDESLKKETEDLNSLRNEIRNMKPEDLYKMKATIDKIDVTTGETKVIVKQNRTSLTELLALADDIQRPNAEHLPRHIRGFAGRIEKKITNMDIAKKLGCELGLNSTKVETLARDSVDANTLFWKELYERQLPGRPLTIGLLISAGQRAGIESVQDDLMSPRHAEAIENSYIRLQKDIRVKDVLPFLRNRGIMSREDIDYITEPKTDREQFKCLVDILPLFGKNAFDYFVDDLKKSGHEHLADILTNELEDLSRESDISSAVENDIGFEVENGVGFEAEDGVGFEAEDGVGFEAEDGFGFEVQDGVGFEVQDDVRFEAENDVDFEAENDVDSKRK
ncbi:uncharacterized protein LOC121376358 [Gigantopelta aegis]|uniref:uncharacterized protein LOC121376358 n=1 Tax=Gigantopelta aegis TaxID=1735272 RepID=UPI001B88A862|nr:uncharacterized protein LOC121376358 [Gigantopelta aegis]XP_041360140.1 uncharacterized protein LOC121376358 [Gigantopelta aegis]XP_041360141.1 uncharacterized protein LOC121376358 [Gigantopelta aegis]